MIDITCLREFESVSVVNDRMMKSYERLIDDTERVCKEVSDIPLIVCGQLLPQLIRDTEFVGGDVFESGDSNAIVIKRLNAKWTRAYILLLEFITKLNEAINAPSPFVDVIRVSFSWKAELAIIQEESIKCSNSVQVQMEILSLETVPMRVQGVEPQDVLVSPQQWRRNSSDEIPSPIICKRIGNMTSSVLWIGFVLFVIFFSLHIAKE